MIVSDRMPNEVLRDSFAFFSRDQLEKLSILGRRFRHLVARYFCGGGRPPFRTSVTDLYVFAGKRGIFFGCRISADQRIPVGLIGARKVTVEI